MSALDYLMKVKEYSLPEAVELIVGRDAIEELPTKEYEFKTNPVKKLLMPELADKPYRAKQYLRERGIYPEIIQYCIDNSLLFETAKYHKCSIRWLRQARHCKVCCHARDEISIQGRSYRQ